MKFYRINIERVFSKSGRMIIVSTRSAKQLSAFTGITREKMSALLSVVDENVIPDKFIDEIKNKIQALGYSGEQAFDIATCFHNFYVGIKYPDGIKKIINNSNLDNNEKTIVLDAFEKILKNSNIEKIDLLEEANALVGYGHASLYGLAVRIEFRPIVKNGKIAKMIPAMVFSGEVEGAAEEGTKEINFQMSVDGFEKLINQLQKVFNESKTQINELKKQLGDNIID